MRKPVELRDWLLASVRDLKKNPEKLQIFIDTGNLQARLQDSLHFEYQYTLNLIVTDFAVSADNLMVPLLAWVKVNQPEMASDAIQFEADIIARDKIDLSLTMPLTERVLVTQGEDGNYTTDHPAEPVPEWNLPEPEALQGMYANGELLTSG